MKESITVRRRKQEEGNGRMHILASSLFQARSTKKLGSVP